MPKSKKYLDLNINREVSDAIKTNLMYMLDAYIEDSMELGISSFEIFSAIYQRDSFLLKYIDENTDPPSVRQQRAVVKWLTVEQRNKRTNERLFTEEAYIRGVGPTTKILNHAAKLIKKILGDVPADLMLKASFSGGASTSIKRGVGTLARKFSGKLDVTPKAWSLLEESIRSTLWATLTPEVLTPRFVKGNVLFTVPKTTLIDRVACKEPDLNVYGQKAVGDYIRNRLRKRASIDLNDQSINRELAREGSIYRNLATIDLSSASDSLTDGLVKWLLPASWYDLLDSLRSPKTFIGDSSHNNEMFSSMGNGFTFELESLIFWALARSVQVRSAVRGRISVYGDDIIVPTAMAGMLIQLLHWCGFKTNASKTFVKGPFRESCGGHYHGGLDVTPFYLRRPLKDVSDLILFLNQYRRWLIITEMDTVENGWNQMNKFTKFWYDLAAFVPKVLWGGTDLASRTQLCSPGTEKCELLRTTRRWARLELDLGIGLYLARLSELDRSSFPADADIREDNVVEWAKGITDSPESTLSTPAEKWVVRRRKVKSYVFGLTQPLFWFEQL